MKLIAQALNRSRTVFDDYDLPCIWDGDRECWVTRNECIFNGPDFIAFRTVLKHTYDKDPLLSSFFTTMLGIRDWTLDDIIHELEERRELQAPSTAISLARDMYQFLCTNVRTDEDWSKIRYVRFLYLVGSSIRSRVLGALPKTA
jgi:hypothetical protein